MVVAPASLVRNVVDSTGSQRVASQQTPHTQQRSLDRAMHLQRCDGVGRAGGVVTARRRQSRRDVTLVEMHWGQEDPCEPSTHRSLITVPHISPLLPLGLTLPAPAQKPVEVLPQDAAVSAVGTGESTHDDAGARLKRTDPLSHEGSHAALDTVAAGGQRDLLLGHDDADESRGLVPSPAGAVVHDQSAVPATRTPTNRGREVLTPR